MVCKNPCRFDIGDGELCISCALYLESLAIISASNFGVADFYICGDCGQRYEDKKSFIEHSPCFSGDTKC